MLSIQISEDAVLVLKSAVGSFSGVISLLTARYKDMPITGSGQSCLGLQYKGGASTYSAQHSRVSLAQRCKKFV